MKKIHYFKILVYSSLFMLLFAACDKIESPYVVPGADDTAQCPAPEFPAVTSHIKRALLEDYTGHNCPNCPRAGVIARDLKAQY